MSTDVNHLHRTGTNRRAQTPPAADRVCHYPGCTASATAEATWLQAWPSGDLFHGTWQPVCAYCALDDAVHQPAPIREFRLIGITLRPIGSAS